MNRLIIGCGYLGSRVAEIWKNQGDKVFLMTRNADRAVALKNQDFSPIQADITQPESLSTLGTLPPMDTILFAVGMDRSRYKTVHEVYVDGLQNVFNALRPAAFPEQFIYVSSTGVYGNADGNWLDEDSSTDPQREGGKACLAAEELIRNSEIADRSTILRFAGIYGPQRVPTQSTIEAGNWNRLSSAGYVNLIQVDDGANLINIMAQQRLGQGEIFCVSDGCPPMRKDYYEYIAELLDISSIPWSEEPLDPKTRRAGSNKRISNRKLIDATGYQFQFPDFRSGVRHAIQAL